MHDGNDGLSRKILWLAVPSSILRVYHHATHLQLVVPRPHRRQLLLELRPGRQGLAFPGPCLFLELPDLFVVVGNAAQARLQRNVFSYVCARRLVFGRFSWWLPCRCTLYFTIFAHETVFCQLGGIFCADSYIHYGAW